jgi:hypothetical protein
MQYRKYLNIEEVCQNSDFFVAAFDPKRREHLNAKSALLKREDLLAEFLFLETELKKPELNTVRWKQHYIELNRYLLNLEECIEDFPTNRLVNRKLINSFSAFTSEDLSLINHSLTIAAGNLNSAFQISRYVKAKELQGLAKNLEQGAMLSSNWKILHILTEENRLEQHLNKLLTQIEVDKSSRPVLKKASEVYNSLVSKRQELACCFAENNYFSFLDRELDIDSILHARRSEGLSYLRENLSEQVSKFHLKYIDQINTDRIKINDSSDLHYWKILADLTKKIDVSGELFDHYLKTRAITRVEEHNSNDAACRYHFEPEFSVMRYNTKGLFSWTVFAHEFAHAMHNYRRFHGRDVLNISNSVTCNEFVANIFELLTLDVYSKFYSKDQASNVMLLNIYSVLKRLPDLALSSQFESELYEDRSKSAIRNFKSGMVDYFDVKQSARKFKSNPELDFKILNNFYNLREKVGINWYYLIAQCAAYQFYAKFIQHPEKSLGQLHKFMQIQQPNNLEEMFGICEIEYKSPKMFFKNTFRALDVLGATVANL